MNCDIEKIIKSLDPNKAHDDDVIKIGRLKICGFSISKPLQLMFRSCFKNNEVRKANVLVHKKVDKNH